MRFPRVVICVLFSFLKISGVFGAHIIGGEMYYECMGYGNAGKDTTKRIYRIYITLYRDCRPQSNAAGFDQPLGFTIWRKNANGTYTNTKSGNNPEYSINSLHKGPDPIDPPIYPCLILPPDICVEKGEYYYDVELPIINQEYVVVWQRCCRNSTISNIQMPDATGITFSVSIHPEAQKTCGSSPRFKNFPPTVICVNEPFSFDHAATDKEGDLLIYSFCPPLAGGGRSGGNGCSATIPSPDCPPPFTEVSFRAPMYSYLFPLTGNPPMTINSITGEITGEPDLIGQFVISVCVSEYRSGVLLSTVRRDFQFNVASCTGTVVAQLDNGVPMGKKDRSILLCNTDQLTMKNSSYQQQFISDILWEYENGGQIETSTVWNPTIKFKEGGLHNGRFILNPGTNCSDTVNFVANVINDLKPDFSFTFDSCHVGPVQFRDTSSSSYSTITNWNWDFGDGFLGFQKNVDLQYVYPDRYTIKLQIMDNFGCVNQIQKPLVWYPSPEVVIFEPSIKAGCVPLKVNFRNISFPTDNSYTFNWKFSDGDEAQGISVDHVFDSIGNYDLKLEVTSPVGCYNEGSFSNVVQVYPPPTAEWMIDKNVLDIKDPMVQLNDLSKLTLGRTWIVNGKDYYYDKDLTLILKDTGFHHIQLIVSDQFLCTDTLEADVFVGHKFTLFMPNAFTPNGDGNNETFLPVGDIHSLEYYSLNIYDRWGSVIFHSSDPQIGWNGKFNNSGTEVPSGAYPYLLNYKVNRSNPVSEKKMLALIR